MCVKHTGVSYLIGTGFDNQTCKSSEQLVTFNVTGPQGPIGPQGPEGASVKVYDADDNVIGYVTSTKDYLGGLGYFEMLDKHLNVIESVYDNFHSAYIGPLGGGTLSGGPQNNVYYVSSNCGGQGYMDGIESGLSFSLFASNSGNKIIDHSVVVSSPLTYHSFIDENGINCVVQTDVIESPSPIKDVQNILDSYARPFHIGL